MPKTTTVSTKIFSSLLAGSTLSVATGILCLMAKEPLWLAAIAGVAGGTLVMIISQCSSFDSVDNSHFADYADHYNDDDFDTFPLNSHDDGEIQLYHNDEDKDDDDELFCFCSTPHPNLTGICQGITNIHCP